MALIFLACLIAAANGLIKIAKSEGESEQPCLVSADWNLEKFDHLSWHMHLENYIVSLSSWWNMTQTQICLMLQIRISS